ncbi:MAG: hypothetical protein KAU28_03205, partial [Phycisphaerae bacterium]|nr:hypothetical protein [Phycisphaerae bacterium]
MGLRANLFARQGFRDKAIETFDLALKLDPHNGDFLAGRLALLKKPTPIDHAEALVGLLRNSPRDIYIARDLGSLLDSLGLYDQALKFFDYAWQLDQRQDDLGNSRYLFLVQYLNAMLNAGQFEQAVEKFQPMLKLFNDGVDLRSLLLEAYRKLDDEEKAEQLAIELDKLYEPKVPTSGISKLYSIGLAQFHLSDRPNPKALVYARIAAKYDPYDPVVKRLLGTALLRFGTDEEVLQGEELLRKLLEKDAYAAAFLAEYYYANGNEQGGKKAVEAGMAFPRTGPEYRRLAALAGKHNVPIGPAKDSDGVRQVVSGLDERYLQMGLEPEKFIKAQIQAVRNPLPPGVGIGVEAILKNIGPIDVPIGRQGRGLLNPKLSLFAQIADGQEKKLANLPPVTWPAPRCLRPGQSVSTTIRLDVGELALLLMQRPLEKVSVKVSGLLDPGQRGEKIRSELPTVSIEPTTITRADLLGKFNRNNPEHWKKAYQLSQGFIVRDLKRGKLTQRMRAARQIASLLALARQVEKKNAKLPTQLQDVFSKAVLIRMMVEMLKDPSDVVRAEMIASLGYVDLDKSIIQFLGGPLIEDPSPLVRMRLVELLGASGVPGQKTMVDYFAADGDNLVRLMASAFRDE